LASCVSHVTSCCGFRTIDVCTSQTVSSYMCICMRYRPCCRGREEIMGSWSFRLGESQIRDSKIWSWEPRDSDQKRIVLVRPNSKSNLKALPLVRESAPQQRTRKCLKILFKRNWSRVQDGCLTPKQAGWQILCRNITLTLVWSRIYALNLLVSCLFLVFGIGIALDMNVIWIT
jgi:hypothetical protein